MANRSSKISSRKAYFALLIAFWALVINFWAWSLLSPLGSKISADLSLSPLNLSLLLAMPVLIGSLGRVVLGMLTDKFGGRKLFIVTSLLSVIPVVSLIFVNNYSQYLAVAALLGLGGAAFVIGIPFVSAWFPPQRRGLVLGLYSMGNAGTALSGFATPRLAQSIGQSATFLIVAVLLFFTALIFAMYGKNAPGWQSVKGSVFTRLMTATRLRLTWDLSAVYAVTFGAYVAFGVYLPTLLKVAYGLSLTDAAARAAGFVLVATIARPLGGWLSDKLGAKFVIKTALLLAIPLALFVAFQPALQHSTTVAYLSLALVLGCSNGAVFALVGRLASPKVMGSVTGIVGAVGGFGGFLPPLVLGLTYQRYHSFSLALIMLAITASIVFIYIHKRFQDKTVYIPSKLPR